MSRAQPYVVLAMAGAKAANQQSPPGHLLGPIFEPPSQLAPYRDASGREPGAAYPEAESATRTCYTRDRDRIIHSTAFRRLKHKTQVFVQHEGDLLSHPADPFAGSGADRARPWRGCWRWMKTWRKRVALAHDLGHTPFGHAGEEALNEVDEGLRRLRSQCPCASARHQARTSLCRFRRAQSHLGNAGRSGQAQRPTVGQGAKPLPGPIAVFRCALAARSGELARDRGADRGARRRHRLCQSRHRRRIARGIVLRRRSGVARRWSARM